MGDEYIFRGDFRVIKLDGLFHVVFRPDAHPEWFRIIATFYTYERAWQYCDLEQVLSVHDESETKDEVKEGRSEPPSILLPDRPSEFDVAQLVRDICPDESAAKPPLAPEKQVEQVVEAPRHDELPKAYRARMSDVAADIARAAGPDPTISQAAPDNYGKIPQLNGGSGEFVAVTDSEPLTDKQTAVLDFMRSQANHLGLLSASLAKISSASGVPHGSISFLLESLERKGLLRKKESGKNGGTSLFQVLAAPVLHPMLDGTR